MPSAYPLPSSRNLLTDEAPETAIEPGRCRVEVIAMQIFRVIVVVDGERTIQVALPLDHAPLPGDLLTLSHEGVVVVRHVIDAPRGDLAGIVLAWAS